MHQLRLDIKMAISVVVIQVVAFFSIISASLNSTSTIPTTIQQLAKDNSSSGNLTIEHRGNNKPLLLLSSSSISHNGTTNTTSSIWNLAHYSSATDHHDHFSASSTLLVITVFIGFTLTGLFLLWRRHRFANSVNLREVVCHYTTLNQEVTMDASDLVDQFHLDISDDTATSSSDDEELLR